MRCGRWLLLLVLGVLGISVSAHAETWYVRSDGGTRFSVNAKDGQCDGKGDAAYPGKGVNRHCAFGDFRYLWDDRATYGKLIWAIAGGDTVIVRKHTMHGKDIGWRVGFDQGKSANDPWCVGRDGGGGCTNPPIPIGTAEHHTRILGENYGACTSPAAKTEIFGGFGLGTVLNLSGAQYVDVQCLNITRHSDCVVHGDPPLPKLCNRDHNPIDDFDSDGVGTDVHTHDVLMQDLWIHGHTDRGIIGPIGGLVTANRVNIGFNGMAGWDFDDGRSTPSVNGDLKFLNSVIEWNGCNQEYPAVHEIPVASCYGQSSGGYGDGIGTPAGMGLNVEIDHSTFRYNTQDGEDFGHVDKGSNKLRITNSISYGNGGAQFKWGGNFTFVVFVNNIVIGNCMRMSAPMNGTPAGYNAHLADYCRATDALSFNFVPGTNALLANNTIVSYTPTTFDIDCWGSSCANSTLLYQNNILLGYDNSKTFDRGGKPGGIGVFYFSHPIGKFFRSNNIYYGVRNFQCQKNELCTDPRFVGQPRRFTQEDILDNFNVHLSPESPGRHAAVKRPDIPIDYDGTPRSTTDKPTIGAIE